MEGSAQQQPTDGKELWEWPRPSPSPLCHCSHSATSLTTSNVHRHPISHLQRAVRLIQHRTLRGDEQSPPFEAHTRRGDAFLRSRPGAAEWRMKTRADDRKEGDWKEEKQWDGGVAAVGRRTD
jgi:hypothetical protein